MTASVEVQGGARVDMATFGLDGVYIEKMMDELDVAHIRNDQASDFFLLPQLNAFYQHCGDQLKRRPGGALQAMPGAELRSRSAAAVERRILEVGAHSWNRTPEDARCGLLAVHHDVRSWVQSSALAAMIRSGS